VPNPGDDRELVLALRRGDPKAWQTLLDRYLRLMAHVARETLRLHRVLHTEDDVDDLVYEVLHNLVRDQYRALAAIGEPYDLKAYLAVAVRRKAIDFARRPRGARVSLDAETDERGGALGDLVAAPEEEDGDAIEATPERLAAVRRAMARLAPRERLLVRLFNLNGMKYRQIAQRTGIPINSIGPTLRRAIEKLRHELPELG
jgi:RNA polymerase sigma factor (sigma-70 family)